MWLGEAAMSNAYNVKYTGERNIIIEAHSPEVVPHQCLVKVNHGFR